MNSIIDITTKKNVILDSQILTALMDCPRASDFRFNHNLIPIGGKSNSLECGSIVHTFLETYYKNIIQGIKRKDAEGFAFTAAELYISGCKSCTNFIPYHNHPITTEKDVVQIRCSLNCIIKPTCRHKPNDYPGVTNTPREPNTSDPREKSKTGWAWVLETLQQYCEYYKNDHWIPLEVEIVKSHLLYEDEDVRILWKAKLDLTADTNQGIFPIDHKTMKQNRSTLSMNNQFMGQCRIMNTSNVIINKVGFQKTLKAEEKFIRQPISYSTERLLEWQSEILPYYAKLLLMYNENEYFPPNFGHCEGKYGSCQYLKVCESNPEMRNDELKKNFIVGPEWNPTNENDNE
jgi:hypothetical protein